MSLNVIHGHSRSKWKNGFKLWNFIYGRMVSYDTWLHPLNGLLSIVRYFMRTVLPSVCHFDNSRRAYPIFMKLDIRSLWMLSLDKFVNGPYRCLSSISCHKSPMCFFTFFSNFLKLIVEWGNDFWDNLGHFWSSFKVIQGQMVPNGLQMVRNGENDLYGHIVILRYLVIPVWMVY